MQTSPSYGKPYLYEQVPPKEINNNEDTKMVPRSSPLGPESCKRMACVITCALVIFGMLGFVKHGFTGARSGAESRNFDWSKRAGINASADLKIVATTTSLPPATFPRNTSAAITTPAVRTTSSSPTQALQIALSRAITPQIILTAKSGDLSDLPNDVQKNVRNTLAMNPSLRVRFLGDGACLAFLDEQDAVLAAAFRQERKGSYRGDICRAVVLFVEGGIYVDVDLQPRVPFDSRFLGSNTFISSLDETGNVFNAIMAAPPKSPVLKRTIDAMKRHYKGEALPVSVAANHMGPYTLCEGVTAVCGLSVSARSKCAHLSPGGHRCGAETIKLFEERRIHCSSRNSPGNNECPLGRAANPFMGVKFGIFGAASEVIAWSRFEACRSWGCGTGGEVMSPR